MASGLETSGIEKRFGANPVLQGLSLAVPPGRVTALVGQNGAGKSTFFRVLMGLLSADAGTALVDGRDVLGLPIQRKLGAGLGYLPQDAASFPDLGVERNLLALLEILPIDRKDRRARSRELLSLVGLEAVADRLYKHLSGGEQRRLEIAKALAGRPRVLLLDEPFSGLDPRIVEELAALLGGLAEDGVAILLTDHNVHMTLAFVDHAYLLAGGRALREGTPREVAESDEAKRLYLGESFTLP